MLTFLICWMPRDLFAQPLSDQIETIKRNNNGKDQLSARNLSKLLVSLRRTHILCSNAWPQFYRYHQRRHARALLNLICIWFWIFKIVFYAWNSRKTTIHTGLRPSGFKLDTDCPAPTKDVVWRWIFILSNRFHSLTDDNFENRLLTKANQDLIPVLRKKRKCKETE